jgi:hypothetical protein
MHDPVILPGARTPVPAGPMFISRLQYRLALPARNAGLAEDSQQKNRKIKTAATVLRAMRKDGGNTALFANDS